MCKILKNIFFDFRLTGEPIFSTCFSKISGMFQNDENTHAVINLDKTILVINQEMAAITSDTPAP